MLQNNGCNITNICSYPFYKTKRSCPFHETIVFTAVNIIFIFFSIVFTAVIDHTVSLASLSCSIKPSFVDCLVVKTTVTIQNYKCFQKKKTTFKLFMIPTVLQDLMIIWYHSCAVSHSQTCLQLNKC